MARRHLSAIREYQNNRLRLVVLSRSFSLRCAGAPSLSERTSRKILRVREGDTARIGRAHIRFDSCNNERRRGMLLVMSWRNDVAYLREKAAQFREMARHFGPGNVALAARLHEVAVEMESKAAEIERRETGRP